MLFPDRKAAGVELARALGRHGAEADVVIGLARGGVIVAERVAARLGAPLGVVVVSVMRSPPPHGAPFGAAISDGTSWIDDDAVRAARIAPAYSDREAASAIVRSRWTQQQLGAGGRRRLAGRRVLLVDDGLVWPGRAMAAAGWARRHGAEHVALAVPVATRPVAQRLRPMLDELVSLRMPELLTRLDEAYVRFPPVGLGEVYALARDHAEAHAARQPTALRVLAAFWHRRPALA